MKYTQVTPVLHKPQNKVHAFFFGGEKGCRLGCETNDMSLGNKVENTRLHEKEIKVQHRQVCESCSVTY